MSQVESKHAVNTVTAYIGGMEHGAAVLLKDSSNTKSAGTPAEYLVLLFTLNITAVKVVAHATCLRVIAHTHRTHAYAMPTHA